MKNVKTITVDSLSAINDMIAEGLYETVYDFLDELQLDAEEHNIEILNTNVDEDDDLITAKIAYEDIQDVKDWFATTSPELSDEDIEDLLASG